MIIKCHCKRATMDEFSTLTVLYISEFLLHIKSGKRSTVSLRGLKTRGSRGWGGDQVRGGGLWAW